MIGLLVARKLGVREAVLYIISQIVGAVIAAAVVYAIFGSSMAASVTLPADGNVIRAFVLETVIGCSFQHLFRTHLYNEKAKYLIYQKVPIYHTSNINLKEKENAK